jgi:hypothetical protein
MTLLFHLSFIGRSCRQAGGKPVEYLDGQPPPTEAELDATRAAAQAAWDALQVPPGRKVWATASAFWAEFTQTEKLAILASAVPEIRLLDRELVLWQGELWSDDPRVQAGLAALVQTGILTEERRGEILALTPS